MLPSFETVGGAANVMHSDFFGSAPLLVLFLLMFVGLALFAALGMRLRGRLHATTTDGNAEANLLSAALAAQAVR